MKDIQPKTYCRYGMCFYLHLVAGLKEVVGMGTTPQEAHADFLRRNK